MVVPDILIGTPAVITTKSPLITIPEFNAPFIASRNISSVENVCFTFRGITPRMSCRVLMTFSLKVTAIMGAFGLNLATALAVYPDLVEVIIAFAPSSDAIEHVAWLIASVMDFTVMCLFRHH